MCHSNSVKYKKRRIAMTKYETTELNEKCRKSELRNYANAMQRLKAEALLFEQKNRHYTEVVYNQCWRNWVYTKYDEYMQDFLDENNLKDFDIINYNDPEVYKNMENLDDEYYRLFSISKEVIKYFQPKSLDELGAVFSVGDISVSGKHLFEVLKRESAVEKPFDEVLIPTHNQILFREQISEILFLLYKTEQDTDFMYHLIDEIRFIADRFHIMREYEQSSVEFSILNYIKDNYPQYYSTLKIAYLSFENSCCEAGIDNPKKLFNTILYSGVVACKKKQATDCAKILYKITKILSKK